MLARDYCDAAKRKNKPIILSHHMLYGLKEGQSKMSKSDPDSAVFMEDTPADVERKIMKAHCPKTVSANTADQDEMQLVKDPLKNPCLDYVKNILMSNFGSTFTAGGLTYETSDAVKEAFLNGKLSEIDLKKGIIDGLNKLLDPVRNHFANDPNASALLTEIRGFSKEPSKDGKFISMRCFADDKPLSFVLAPLPSSSVRLQDVVSTLYALRSGATPGRRVVLWLQDWTAFVLNATKGDRGAIAAYYELLIGALRGLDPGLMKDVEVMNQSKTAFAHASDYWLSVINVGRANSLEDLRPAVEKTTPFVNAGQVIGAMLLTGDVLAASAVKDARLFGTADQVHLMEFALRYVKTTPLHVPTLGSAEDTPELVLNDANNETSHVMVTDADNTLGGKLKKAFCEPANVAFCPPLELARWLP